MDLPRLSFTSCTRIWSLGNCWLTLASRSTLGPAAQALALPAVSRPASRRVVFRRPEPWRGWLAGRDAAFAMFRGKALYRAMMAFLRYGKGYAGAGQEMPAPGDEAIRNARASIGKNAAGRFGLTGGGAGPGMGAWGPHGGSVAGVRAARQAQFGDEAAVYGVVEVDVALVPAGDVARNGHADAGAAAVAVA